MTVSSRYGLSDLLRGLVPGRMQSVGLMQIIPLIGEEATGYLSPDEVEVESPQYGILGFMKRTKGKVIIPSGAAYMTKENAQDHTLPHPGVIAKNANVSRYNTAACIQSSMPGHMVAAKRPFTIVPYAVKAAGLRVRHEVSYSKLWGFIENLNREAGLAARGHLDDFTNGFAKQLDQFVAEFEPVPQMLGAIVIVNGAVVGIERSPSYEHWLSCWKPLVRDCYGSHAMMVGRTNKIPPPNRIPLGRCDSIQALFVRLAKVTEQESEQTRSLVRGLMGETFGTTLAPQTPQEAMKVYDIAGLNFSGNAVFDEEAPVYLSLLAISAKSAKQAFRI